MSTIDHYDVSGDDVSGDDVSRDVYGVSLPWCLVALESVTSVRGPRMGVLQQQQLPSRHALRQYPAQ